jgi:hypothetical protein
MAGPLLAAEVGLVKILTAGRLYLVLNRNFLDKKGLTRKTALTLGYTKQHTYLLVIYCYYYYYHHHHYSTQQSRS